MREVLRAVGIYLLASVICAGFALLVAIPYHPRTMWGWLLLFLLALPLWLIGEWLGRLIFTNKLAHAIDSQSDNRGWWFRALYLFLVAVLAFGAFAAVWLALDWLGFTHL